MKKRSGLLLAILLIMGVSHLFYGQSTQALASSNVNANLIVPLSLTETASLDFGTINVLGGVSGTVILPSDSTERVFTGVVGSAVTPLPSNAAYTVSGTKNVSYGVSLPVTITVYESGGSDTMLISNLKARFDGAATDGTTSILKADGTDRFTLGGTLIIEASQTPGAYTGTFNVSVDYN